MLQKIKNYFGKPNPFETKLKETENETKKSYLEQAFDEKDMIQQKKIQKKENLKKFTKPFRDIVDDLNNEAEYWIKGTKKLTFFTHQKRDGSNVFELKLNNVPGFEKSINIYEQGGKYFFGYVGSRLMLYDSEEKMILEKFFKQNNYKIIYDREEIGVPVKDKQEAVNCMFFVLGLFTNHNKDKLREIAKRYENIS